MAARGREYAFDAAVGGEDRGRLIERHDRFLRTSRQIAVVGPDRNKSVISNGADDVANLIGMSQEQQPLSAAADSRQDVVDLRSTYFACECPPARFDPILHHIFFADRTWKL